ncbi:MAG: phosphatase PAP2 family protein [Haloplanus sp.]
MSRAVPTVADRGVGETAVVRTLPEGVVELFRVLTHLGDPVALLLLVAGGYLLANYLGISSTRMAAAMGLALGGFALTLALKYGFALPRPPGAGTDGFGFPSGHAIGATVVYGGLAGVLAPRDRRVTRVAAVLVVVVAASRVVIGVHYLVDVVAGVAIGVAYLGVALRFGPGWAPERVTAPETGRTFALAVAVGLVAPATALVTDTVVAAAAAVGGWIGWRATADRVTDAVPSTRRLVASIALIPGVVVVALLVLDGGMTLPVAGGLAGGTVAIVVAIPGLAA